MHKKQIRPLARLHGYWLYRGFLSRTSEWPLEQRRAYIFKHLQQTLQRANEGIPFYRERFREAGFDPRRHFKVPQDISKVPILTKEDVRQHHEKMVDNRFVSTSVVANTSGTTGQPMTMRLGLYYIAFDYATMYRFWSQAGYTFRARYAALRSYVPKTPGEPLWKFNFWQNTLYMSAYHLKPSNSHEYVEALLRFRPRYLRGYASALNVLAEYAFERREEFNFLRGVFTASETLTPAERANIERTFGKKLYDWYGMTEPAVIITETSTHDGMEVNWEYGFPEFVEGQSLGSTERRLLATSLHNPVMPFIRYETEDVVRLQDTVDKAGLYPRIAAVIGRKDECILTPDGGRLPTLNFYSLLQVYTDILRFQLVQSNPSEVTMKITLRPETRDVAALLEKLRRESEQRLGPLVKLKIEQTEEFERSPDGKTPAFKRLFRTPGEAARSINPLGQTL